MYRVAIALGFTLNTVALCADENPLVQDSPEAACDTLRNRVALIQGLPTDNLDARWYCETSNISNDYLYIIALHAIDHLNYVHSNLVGWFAVARRSTLVMEYDVAQDRLVPISASHFASKASP